MKRKFWILTALAMLVLSMLACNLPAVGAPSPRATDAPAGATPAAPAATADSSAADPDLPRAVLSTADLPAGFIELSPNDFQSLGIDESMLTGTFGDVLKNAETQSLKGFLNQQNFEVVVNFVLAPLTFLEKAAFDAYLSRPENVIQQISGNSVSSDARVIEGMNTIGDSSIGVTFTTGASPQVIRGDVSISRRGNTVTANMIFYMDGATPVIGIQEVAQLMDQRVEAALK